MEFQWAPITTAGGGKGLSNTSNWWNGISASAFPELGKKEGVFNADITELTKFQDHAILMDGNNTSREIDAFGTTLSTSTGINEIGAGWAYAGPTTQEMYTIGELTDDVLFFIGGHDNPGGGCNKYDLSITAKITPEFLKFYEGLPDSETFVPGGMVSVETQQKAQESLVTLNDAIVIKDKIRANLGAMQNRLENTVSNISIQGENLPAAEARISDTDIAIEMTQFVRNQVLTQSAIAILGQANSYPHMLLSLLNG